MINNELVAYQDGNKEVIHQMPPENVEVQDPMSRTGDSMDDPTRIGFISETAAFLRRNAIRLGVVSAAAVGVGAMAPTVSIAKQKTETGHVVPLNFSIMSLKTNFLSYLNKNILPDGLGEQIIGGDPVMGTLAAAPHTIEVKGSCNLFKFGYTGISNQNSFVRYNRSKSVVEGCAQADNSSYSSVPMAGKAGFCESARATDNESQNVVNSCLNFNLVPAMAEPGEIAAEAVHVSDKHHGNAYEMILSGGSATMVHGRIVYYFDRAEIEYRKGNEPGNQLKELILQGTLNRVNEVSKTWY